jgi:YVTN family beta-propeller protein
MNGQWFRLSALVVALVVARFAEAADDSSKVTPAASSRRKPVALALGDQGKWLYSANAATGTISVIDTELRKIVAEPAVSRSLADLAITPDGRALLALDAADNCLQVLSRDGSTVKVMDRTPVAPDPVSVAVSADGLTCTVASRWSRRLSVVTLKGERRLAKAIDLPFAPRRQAFVGGAGRLVVADAFGGALALIDVARGKVESVRTVQAHNIGGLALSADGTRLFLTQQYLNAMAKTGADDIHWGFLMTNSVRSLPLAAVLAPAEDLIFGVRLDHLGEPGHGAGDPSGLAALPDGVIVTALAGVNEVAIGPIESADAKRIVVGRRPTAVVAGPGGALVYVANSLDDSVSVVDVRAGSVVATIALGEAPPETTLVDLGERLFHDATLSHEGWMSCQSCHTDGHASAVKADTLGDGSYGAPKRTLSLLGIAETAPYAWDGKVATLEEQVRKSFVTTLRGKAPGDDDARAVAAFLRTLPPAPPKGNLDAAAVARGQAVFASRRCERCHTPPAYTSGRAYDVGLADEVGNTFFNPPTLRGVSQRGALFHDSRARSLEEVFTRFGHPDKVEMPERNVADLVEFLRSL